jgi:hypothetical protein
MHVACAAPCSAEILEVMLSVYNTVLLPQSTPAAAQQGVKQEPFYPQGGPGVQLQHARLAVVPPQQQQQPSLPPKPDPTSHSSQGQQQRTNSVTVWPAAVPVQHAQQPLCCSNIAEAEAAVSVAIAAGPYGVLTVFQGVFACLTLASFAEENCRVKLIA